MNKNTNIDPKTLGGRIKMSREAKGETQEQLGDILHLTKDSISKYERNENRPTIETLMKISEHYNVSLDYLFARSPNIVDPYAILDILENYIPSHSNDKCAFGEITAIGSLMPMNFYKYIYVLGHAKKLSEDKKVNIPSEALTAWVESEKKKFIDSIINPNPDEELIGVMIIPYSDFDGDFDLKP